MRWLRTLLLSTDRTGDLPLTGDSSAGRTTLAPAALADAVSGEISGYPGVRSARARLIGDPLAPTLVITATLEDGADLPGVRRRIEADAGPACPSGPGGSRAAGPAGSHRHRPAGAAGILTPLSADLVQLGPCRLAFVGRKD